MAAATVPAEAPRPQVAVAVDHSGVVLPAGDVARLDGRARGELDTPRPVHVAEGDLAGALEGLALGAVAQLAVLGAAHRVHAAVGVDHAIRRAFPAVTPKAQPVLIIQRFTLK